MPGLAPADILAAIRQASAPQANRDENWKTCKGWAKAWGVTAQTALRHLQDGQGAGVVETRKLIDAATGKRSPHYRYTGKAK